MELLVNQIYEIVANNLTKILIYSSLFSYNEDDDTGD